MSFFIIGLKKSKVYVIINLLIEQFILNLFIKKSENIVNKTFIRISESLGYVIGLICVKYNESYAEG